MPKEGTPVNGPRIRQLRTARLLEQAELADEIGVHANTISILERKPGYRVSFKTIKDLARFFEVDPQDLVDPVDQEIPA